MCSPSRAHVLSVLSPGRTSWRLPLSLGDPRGWDPKSACRWDAPVDVADDLPGEPEMHVGLRVHLEHALELHVRRCSRSCRLAPSCPAPLRCRRPGRSGSRPRDGWPRAQWFRTIAVGAAGQLRRGRRRRSQPWGPGRAEAWQSRQTRHAPAEPGGAADCRSRLCGDGKVSHE